MYFRTLELGQKGTNNAKREPNKAYILSHISNSLYLSSISPIPFSYLLFIIFLFLIPPFISLISYPQSIIPYPLIPISFSLSLIIYCIFCIPYLLSSITYHLSDIQYPLSLIPYWATRLWGISKRAKFPWVVSGDWWVVSLWALSLLSIELIMHLKTQSSLIVYIEFSFVS